MKKSICAIGLLLSLFLPIVAWAKDKPEDITEPIKVDMTCYAYTGNKCANGKYPKIGTCAYQRKYLNYTAIVYEDNNGEIGDFIGYFEIYDTGYGRATDKINPKTNEPYGTIELGMSIDIYREDLEACYDFIAEHGDKAWVQIVYAEG